MTNPYEDLPLRAFWKPAVGSRNPEQIIDLWKPKFRFNKKHKIATFGSKFGQHFTNALVNEKYDWCDAEPAPRFVSDSTANNFNYGIYSARTGEIQTVKELLQWVEWASGEAVSPREVWKDGDRYFDPFRPEIEPDGFLSEAEVYQSRDATIRAVKKAILQSSRFVFTIEHTESWVSLEHGYAYATSPQSGVGKFDEKQHGMVNQSYSEVYQTLFKATKMMRKMNPKLAFLYMVSPAPLSATISDQHVLIATMRSKSVLRAAVGFLRDCFSFVDYFPSYEITNSPAFEGRFFDADKRAVSANGVKFVIKNFFLSINHKSDASSTRKPATMKTALLPEEDIDESVCEEQLLQAFAK